MQKKTAARHVGSCMVTFVTKCLICFFDRKTRFTPRSGIDCYCNFKITKISISHFSEENSYFGEKTFPRVFHLDPVFSTRFHVFHQTPCFPHPAFSKPRVFHTPGPRTPGPRPRVIHLANRKVYIFLSIILMKTTTIRYDLI